MLKPLVFYGYMNRVAIEDICWITEAQRNLDVGVQADGTFGTRLQDHSFFQEGQWRGDPAGEP